MEKDLKIIGAAVIMVMIFFTGSFFGYATAPEKHTYITQYKDKECTLKDCYKKFNETYHDLSRFIDDINKSLS